jgi:RNA polymerase sigma factor (sigma-70 family)
VSVAEGRGEEAGDKGPDGRSAHVDAGLLYERYAARIQRFCVGRLDDRDEAADAVQDTFLRAWLALENGVEVRHPLPWLLTIADNVCVSRFRARSARVATTELSEESRGDFTDAVGNVAGLASALRALPVRQRQALLRREVQGYSYDEIGAELGVSRASVAALLHRARLAVADTLRDVRRGVAALVPVPAILRIPFEGGAATGAAVVGTTTVIAVAQLAGAGPAPSSAAPPGRTAEAVAAAVEPGRPAAPTRVHVQKAGSPTPASAPHEVAGEPQAARAVSSPQHATDPQPTAPLPESPWNKDLVGGPRTSGEPEPSPTEAHAPASEAADPEQLPQATQPAGRPDSHEVATPTGKKEKGAKGRSAAAPGHAGKPERPGDNTEVAGESPSLPPQARGNGPPERDVAPEGAGELELGAGRGNGGGQGNGRSEDNDTADKGSEGKGGGKGGGPPIGPSP